jgi:hypothetical protein
MRVYVAAPWKQREAAREVAYRLIVAGLLVTSRWLWSHGDTDDPTLLNIEAHHDLEDVRQAQIMLVLNLEMSEGKATEQGIALERGMHIIGVGRPTQIFHHHENYEWVANVDDAIAIIGRL